MFNKLLKNILITFILYIWMLFSVSANSQEHVVLNIWETKTIWSYQVTNTTDHKIFAPITDLSWKVLWNTQIDTGKQYWVSLNETDLNYPYTVWWFKIENIPVATNYCYAWWPVPCEVTEYYWDIWNWDSNCLNWIIAQSVVCKNIWWTIVPSSNCTWLPYPTWYDNWYITWTCWSCWTANWTTLTTKPTTAGELCSAGTSTTVSWTWP